MSRSSSLSALLFAGLSAACSPAGRPAETPTNRVTPIDTVTQPSRSTVGKSSAAPASDSADVAELVAYGREVYRQQYCGLCHRLDAVNTSGAFGPPHTGMGTTAANRIRDPNYTGSATTAEGYIRESIIDPDMYIVSGYGGSRFRMPAYAHLSEADVNALVRMLLGER